MKFLAKILLALLSIVSLPKGESEEETSTNCPCAIITNRAFAVGRDIVGTDNNEQGEHLNEQNEYSMSYEYEDISMNARVSSGALPDYSEKDQAFFNEILAREAINGGQDFKFDIRQSGNGTTPTGNCTLVGLFWRSQSDRFKPENNDNLCKATPWKGKNSIIECDESSDTIITHYEL